MIQYLCMTQEKCVLAVLYRATATVALCYSRYSIHTAGARQAQRQKRTHVRSAERVERMAWDVELVHSTVHTGAPYSKVLSKHSSLGHARLSKRRYKSERRGVRLQQPFRIICQSPGHHDEARLQITRTTKLLLPLANRRWNPLEALPKHPILPVYSYPIASNAGLP